MHWVLALSNISNELNKVNPITCIHCILKYQLFWPNHEHFFFKVLISTISTHFKQTYCHSFSPLLFLLITFSPVMCRYSGQLFINMHENIFISPSINDKIFNKYQWMTLRICHTLFFNTDHPTDKDWVRLPT